MDPKAALSQHNIENPDSLDMLEQAIFPSNLGSKQYFCSLLARLFSVVLFFAVCLAFFVGWPSCLLRMLPTLDLCEADMQPFPQTGHSYMFGNVNTQSHRPNLY
jgi:hypothetical protein